LNEDERVSYLEDVARRAAPSFDFFLFSLLAGSIISFGLLIDSPFVLLLGALIAPLMAPLVGMALGTVLGAARTFLRGLGGLIIGGFLVTLCGALFGLLARIWLPLEMVQANLNTQLAWPSFLILGLGAVTTSSMIARDKFAVVYSTILAYGLYIPLATAGFGLGSGTSHLWTNGLVVFAIHLSWSVLVGAATLAVMGFRPYTLFGYSIGGVVLLVCVILVIASTGAGAVISSGVALPTLTPTPSITPTITQTPSPTPVPPTSTLSPTPSPVPPTDTLTPTNTLSPTPTPIEARVQVGGEFTGALLRDAPEGEIIHSVFNGWLLYILSEEPIVQNGAIWIHVLDVENDVDGWILQRLVATATPLNPTNLPTASPTLAIPTDTPQPPTNTAIPTS
jgi:uncharacterized membrane protein